MGTTNETSNMTTVKGGLFTDPNNKEKIFNTTALDNEDIGQATTNWKQTAEAQKKVITKLEMDIEHLRSILVTYDKWLIDFITNAENDFMDGIAELRAKRIELENFKTKEL